MIISWEELPKKNFGVKAHLSNTYESTNVPIHSDRRSVVYSINNYCSHGKQDGSASSRSTERRIFLILLDSGHPPLYILASMTAVSCSSTQLGLVVTEWGNLYHNIRKWLVNGIEAIYIK